VSQDLLEKLTVLVHNFTGKDAMHADLINNITDAIVGGLLITTSDGLYVESVAAVLRGVGR
jgi:hypothetical protein